MAARGFGRLARAGILAIAALGSGHDEPAQMRGEAVLATPSLPGDLGHHHRQIWTASPEAQRLFDVGLTLVYAFNHEEAIRAFKRAAEFDPKAPMPLWGVAYALGPNINDSGPGQARVGQAHDMVEHARSLAASAPSRERAWVEALAPRYSLAGDRRMLAVAYKDAMSELTARYPDDLDAATLYAEAIMDLRPWRLWGTDGTPAPGTEEMIDILESVLRRNPLHPGANHYYIHALEASPVPERALTSARRLETLVPGAGHLVHMPSHIYMRIGDYQRAEASSAAATRVDESYISRTGVTGLYPLAYYAHNLRFMAYAAGMQGRFADANSAADRLTAYINSLIGRVPMAEMLLSTRVCVLARFGKWADVRKLPAPPAAQSVSLAFHYYAQAVAHAVAGDVAAAVEARATFATSWNTPRRMMIGNNLGEHLFDVAANVIDARIASARGDSHAAIESWRKAVAAQDSLAYSEPPDWYYPVRESLGAALLLSGRPDEAADVFREDLRRNPSNGRSLFGLSQALAALDHPAEAERVRKEFTRAWTNADVVLRIADL